MCRVDSLKMMWRYGLSCCGKDAKLFIFYALVVLSSFRRLEIMCYAAKEYVLCCLLHVSTNIEANLGGRGGR